MTRILLLFCLVACLPVFAQQSDKFTISVDNVPLKKVIKQIEQYQKYSFVYRTEFLQSSYSVTVHVKDGTIEEVMKQALKGLGLNYKIIGTMITVFADSTARPAPAKNNKPELLTVEGQIINEADEPLVKVSVQEAGSLKGVTSNSNGQFSIAVKPNTEITFSCIGYEPVTKFIKDQTLITIRLKPQVKDLDETVITGYGKTSKRYNTGSIYKINQTDIARQPVADPIAAMQGRVPGLLITQSNGLPGASYKIQLRGQSSIGIVPGRLPPNDPLFIIDGNPYAPNNNPVGVVASGSALGEPGRSPLSFINISDIEHIEVLKDADATAIYGSRGSNGVILISTRKGKPGAPIFNCNINSGYSKITRYPTMMNTAQYVQMRREALNNDSLPISNSTAPDLLTWDTTRNTDFKKMLIGGQAVTSNVQLSLSGGSKRLQYFLGGAYHRETTVFPGDLSNSRLSGHANVHYQSRDSNLNVALSLIVTGDKNNSIQSDLTTYIKQAPNAPALYDSTGKLNWDQEVLEFINPLSLLLKTYESKTSNILGNFDINYRIVKNLVFKTNLGYNRLKSDEVSIVPGNSLNPFSTPDARGYSYFGKITYDSWIAEPQLEYTRYFGKGKIAALVGTAMQVQTNYISKIDASDFSSETLLRYLSEAATQEKTELNTEYRYGGVFARLNSMLCDKYLINLTGRIDGSSRFGPGKQVGTFWSTAAGWIFSNEPVIKSTLPFISFGKLRSSYGITGNDQIGDYKYLDKWQDVIGAYQGNTGIAPVQLADSIYSWEVSRKFEAAIDLGFFKDRLMISAAYYQNRTGNQLIAYTLPVITGFTSYAAKNSRAVVQNTGWEIEVQAKSRLSRYWQWTGSILLTIPRNKLLAFPNLAASSYAGSLVIGQPISVQQGYAYNGVNIQTGLFDFIDRNGDSAFSLKNDSRINGNFDPRWYGTIQSNLQYKGWQLDVFFEIRKQSAYGILYAMYKDGFPGTKLVNQPILALNPWQQPNDYSLLQQYTTGANADASNAIARYIKSDAVIEDASFCRLRNIELSWRVPAQGLKKIALKNCRIYLQAQNLFTITRYKGVDPETGNLFTLPPLRTMVGGIELSF
jgi:TonB-linked SusC/RagA family outer membrane protein